MTNTYLAMLAAGFLCSWVLTPAFGWLSRRFGVIDKPNARKIHLKPTPKGGGGAIVLGLIFAGAVGLALWHGTISLEWYVFLLSCAAIAVIGWVDDKVELTPGRKLLATAIPTMAWTLVVFPLTPDGVLNALLGSGFIIFALNSVNLLDGLDGLAAGVGSIAALALGIAAALQANVGVAICALALSGAAAGFLPHNFQPASIFMGDTGSLTIGFALAALGLRFSGGLMSAEFPVALAVLALPFFDTLIAIIRRRMHHRPLFAADKSHTYNLLVIKGYSVRTTVLLCYACAALFGVMAVGYSLLAPWWGRVGLLVMGVSVLIMLAASFDFLQVDQDVAGQNRTTGA